MTEKKIPKDGLRTAMDDLKRVFRVSVPEANRIIYDFHREMVRGLSCKKSSLRMLPAYVDRPTGGEKGKFIALDLGGTNLRALEFELKGFGRSGKPKIMKFTLSKEEMDADSSRFFDFIAKSLKLFLKKEKIRDASALGFTFSFPVRQSGIKTGILVCWTKGFNVKGVIGRDVVGLLTKALIRNRIRGIDITALVNDTVGTLAAKAYSDRNCDVGIILGTGTNACYIEPVNNIIKIKSYGRYSSSNMVVNVEWGNFNKLKRTVFDDILDKDSANPAEQILEKMVSGMYLGELARIVLLHFNERGLLFSPTSRKILSKKGIFKTDHMSGIEGDSLYGLKTIDRLLNSLGIIGSTLSDRTAVKNICSIISERASRITAACTAAIITRMDPDLSRMHTIAIDGTLYEKHPNFSKNMRQCLIELLKGRASRVRISLAKDASGKGAAIIAAVAMKGAWRGAKICKTTES